MEERLALAVGFEELETKLEQFLAGERDVEGAYRGSVGGSASSSTATDVDTAAGSSLDRTGETTAACWTSGEGPEVRLE